MTAFRRDVQALELVIPGACGKEMVGLRRDRLRWRTLQRRMLLERLVIRFHLTQRGSVRTKLVAPGTSAAE